MLSKLKGQLEEMKSKAQFLGLVKKYLQASRPAPPPAPRGFPAVATLGTHPATDTPTSAGPHTVPPPRGGAGRGDRGVSRNPGGSRSARSAHSRGPQVLYAEQWGLEPGALPLLVNVAAAHCGAPDFSPLDESSSLIFYNVSKHPRGGRQRKARVLQAGTPLGLMAYLYSRCTPCRGRSLGAPRAPLGFGKGEGDRKRNRPHGGEEQVVSLPPRAACDLEKTREAAAPPGLGSCPTRASMRPQTPGSQVPPGEGGLEESE